MRTAAKIDAAGFFVEDVLLEDNEPGPAGVVESRPAEGFHRPKWDGSGWVEGKSVSELLVDAKIAKRSEIARAFVAANTALYSEVQEEFSVWLALPEYAADPGAERPTQILANISQFQQKLVEVDAAMTIEEVEAISWT